MGIMLWPIEVKASWSGLIRAASIVGLITGAAATTRSRSSQRHCPRRSALILGGREMAVESTIEFVREQIELLKAQEQLRQQRETFDQRKRHDSRWFLLKLAMGWNAMLLLPGIGVVCSAVIFNHREFSPATVTAATAALFVDALGLVLNVWRLVLGKSPDPLQPIGNKTDQSADASRPTSRGGARRAPGC
jgi:hypothetical protein